ncbi:hypothetical protein [Nocardia brasiliensis]|uniref:hypothetical protein n=1 Tax=Nocardia brasiliensis TaxID=37326 RepID=UPI003D908CFF
MVKAAEHVNTWTNTPPPNPDINLPRTRGMVINTYTPRLLAVVERLVEEFTELAGGFDDQRIATELYWRLCSWLSNYTTSIYGRNSDDDKVACWIPSLGAFIGVLREYSPSIPEDLKERMMVWSTKLVAHLHPEYQKLILERTEETLEIRGRVGNRSQGLTGSEGLGSTRWVDGVWDLTQQTIMICGPAGSAVVPHNMRPEVVRMFNALQGPSKRKVGELWDEEDDGPTGGCFVCSADRIFEGFVDNRPSTNVNQSMMWGILLYSHNGLGSRFDVDLGTGA